MDRRLSVLYTGPDFIASVEYADGFIFIHCEVLDKSIKTLRKIRTGIKELKELLHERGYYNPLLTYSQNPRWVKLLGAQYKNTFEYEGREFELWAWEE